MDANGIVGQSDLVVLLDYLGTDYPPADLDGSGVVDAEDLALMLGQWGFCQ